jgi:hypothetical protein
MDKRPKIISGIVTAAVAILVIVMLVSWHLNVNVSKGKQWPPVKEFELIAEDIEDPESFVSTYSSSADDIWEEQADTAPAPRTSIPTPIRRRHTTLTTAATRRGTMPI